MKKLLMVLMLCGAALAQAEDEVKATGKSVDVMKFDINGIRLGMSQEEALKILKEKFPIDKRTTEEKSSNYSKLHGKPYIKEIKSQSKDKDREFMTVSFQPNVLENKPQELVVSAVDYFIKSSISPDISALNMEKAIDKYGEPVTLDSKGRSFWCDMGAGEKGCIGKPYLVARELSSAFNITLTLGNDKALQEAADKAAKEAGKAEKAKQQIHQQEARKASLEHSHEALKKSIKKDSSRSENSGKIIPLSELLK